MVHSCKKRNSGKCSKCGLSRSRVKSRNNKKMRGGGCGCSSAPSFLLGGKRRSKKKMMGGFEGNLSNPSPGLDILPRYNHYTLNTFQNDPSDPSQITNGRFSDVLRVDQNSMIGGNRRKRLNSTQTGRKKKYGKKSRKTTRKMKGGGNPVALFAGAFGSSSNNGIFSNQVLGSNYINQPSILQDATNVNTGPMNAYGYSNNNPYLV